MSNWCLSDVHLMSIWGLSDVYLMSIWCLSHLISISSDVCLISKWFLMSIWCLTDVYLMSNWCLSTDLWCLSVYLMSIYLYFRFQWERRSGVLNSVRTFCTETSLRIIISSSPWRMKIFMKEKFPCRQSMESNPHPSAW